MSGGGTLPHLPGEFPRSGRRSVPAQNAAASAIPWFNIVRCGRKLQQNRRIPPDRHNLRIFPNCRLRGRDSRCLTRRSLRARSGVPPRYSGIAARKWLPWCNSNS